MNYLVNFSHFIDKLLSGDIFFGDNVNDTAYLKMDIFYWHCEGNFDMQVLKQYQSFVFFRSIFDYFQKVWIINGYLRYGFL